MGNAVIGYGRALTKCHFCFFVCHARLFHVSAAVCLDTNVIEIWPMCPMQKPSSTHPTVYIPCDFEPTGSCITIALPPQKGQGKSLLVIMAHHPYIQIFVYLYRCKTISAQRAFSAALGRILIGSAVNYFRFSITLRARHFYTSINILCKMCNSCTPQKYRGNYRR